MPLIDKFYVTNECDAISVSLDKTNGDGIISLHRIPNDILMMNRLDRFFVKNFGTVTEAF